MNLLVAASLGVLFCDERPREASNLGDFALEASFFMLDITSASNLGDRRTGVLSTVFGVFTFGSLDPSFAAARLGAPNLRGVRPGVRLCNRPGISFGDVLSRSPFIPLFSGSRMNAHRSSVAIFPSSVSSRSAGRTLRSLGVDSALGAALSKYPSSASESARGFVKLKYFGAVNSHLRRGAFDRVSRAFSGC